MTPDSAERGGGEVSPPLVSRRAAPCVCVCARLYIPAIIACWSDVAS